MKKFLKIIQRYHPIVVFVLLAIIVVHPFREGYFFLLDYVSHPHVSADWKSVLGAPIGWVFVNTFIPLVFTSAIAQKLTLFLVTFLLGIGGFKMTQKYGAIPAYFTGLLAILNPFVYSRILDGQIGPILSLVLLLWGSVYLIEYSNSFQWKPLVLASIFFGISIGFMTHSAFMIFIVLVVFFTFHFPEDTKWKKYLFGILLSFGIIVMINANWLGGQLFSANNMDLVNNVIDTRHFTAFASEAGDSSIYFNTLSLHGYWGEGEYRFLPSTYFIENWGVAFLAVFFFVVLGIFYGVRKKETQKNTGIFLIIAIMAYVLSMGIASPHFGFITQWLYDWVPFYKGMREPQKWVALLLISYLYFSAIGASEFLELKFIRKSKKIWASILVALPIFYTFSMLWGFMGQLKTSDYPKDWYEVSETWMPNSGAATLECEAIKQNISKECYDVLALPWHQYMHFKFARRIIANPIGDFFYHLNVLQGDNIEIGMIYSHSSRPESEIIQGYVGPGKDRQELTGRDFANDLSRLGIRYILMVKEVDWEGYNQYLEDNPALKTIWDSENLLIYEII